MIGATSDLLRLRVIQFNTTLAKLKSIDVTEFAAALPNSFCGDVVGKLFRALPEPAMNRQATVRVTFPSSPLQVGDVVTGIKKSDSPSFTGMKTWHEAYMFLLRNGSNLVLRVNRGGTTVQITKPSG